MIRTPGELSTDPQVPLLQVLYGRPGAGPWESAFLKGVRYTGRSEILAIKPTGICELGLMVLWQPLTECTPIMV